MPHTFHSHTPHFCLSVSLSVSLSLCLFAVFLRRQVAGIQATVVTLREMTTQRCDDSVPSCADDPVSFVFGASSFSH